MANRAAQQLAKLGRGKKKTMSEAALAQRRSAAVRSVEIRRERSRSKADAKKDFISEPQNNA